MLFACHRKAHTDASSVLGNPVTNVISNTATGIPACIQQKIDSIKKLPVWNPPAQIELYDYNNQKIYVVSADCCDFFSSAFNENCEFVCAPSGGFTGRGDGKCSDFNEKAKLVSIVWKDDRTKK